MPVQHAAPRITELTYYPIKGCAGFSVSEAVMTTAGLSHDRSFMVTDEQGVFRSQRRDFGLALIRPRIDEDGSHMTLEAPGVAALKFDVDTTSARRSVELFGAPFTGIDQGDEAAAWISEVLAAPSRLVRVPPEHDRVTNGLVPGTSGYADSCAVHMISGSSLRHLNDRVTARGGEPLSMRRFRPNVVVDGWAEPHTEDRVRRIRIGEVELAFAKLAVRCSVTLVDQETGRRAGPEPIRSLAAHRRTDDGVVFGSKFAVVRPGRLAVGDEITVEAWDVSGS